MSTAVWDIELAGPVVNVELKPKGNKGDKGDTGAKGDTGSPGSLGAGLLSARPSSAAAGQTYTATDTGLTYVWTGSSWLVIGAVTASTLLASAVPTAAPAAVTFSADSTFYGVPELTTPDFVWPAGLVNITAPDVIVSATGVDKVDLQLQYSTDGGSTWVGGSTTRVTAADSFLALFGRGRELGMVLSSTRVVSTGPTVTGPAIGATVRCRVAVARTAGSGLASIGFGYGAGVAFPTVLVEQVR